MDISENYLKAYSEVAQSGLVDNEVVQKHVEEYSKIDALLPNLASFFYIVEPTTRTYHFLGKQQESISGIDNSTFTEQGVQAFLQRVHPDETVILVNEVYLDFYSWYNAVKNKISYSDIVFQYNYRFLNRNGLYINLIEYIYILEVDDNHQPSLLLGNVMASNTTQSRPIKTALKAFRPNEVVETLFSKTYGEEISRYELTKRELDILRNLATGKTSKQIGNQLFISPHTVDTHRRNLLKKMDCSSVVELAQIAFRNGLL
jgi:DNA-binding CsgD family transcriptional regulator